MINFGVPNVYPYTKFDVKSGLSVRQLKSHFQNFSMMAAITIMKSLKSLHSFAGTGGWIIGGANIPFGPPQ